MARISDIKQLYPHDRIKTGIAMAAGMMMRNSKSPDQTLGELFQDVQKHHILSDSKSFVDLVPKKRAQAIRQEYNLAKADPKFDLREFVSRHFYEFAPHKQDGEYHTDPNETIDEHIDKLWGRLERRNRKQRGSLLSLPFRYIVPGGRFSEQFYWDSYFIMLGLAASGRWTMVSGMMRNFAHLIRTYGFIPTANRTYFLSRSQPPYFALMVKLLASHRGKRRTYFEYLPYMLAEYRWWIRGRDQLEKREHRAYARLVEMPDGSRLARYYDNRTTPRPESLHEDLQTARRATDRDADRLYLHLRAGAESGWDFSSRWFLNETELGSIHTSDIVPVDLNSLLYILEHTIADTYRLMKQPLLANKFDRLAKRRADAINKYCWNDEDGAYTDYNFHHGRQTNGLTLAMVYPLFARIASKRQADRVADHIRQDFLKPGGLVTTLVDSGQQWDSPNGWAPLQWMTVVGLRNYGQYALANEIKQRWMKTNERVFAREKKMIEKYDVIHPDGLGGGGEYPLQDGFGWTNGVYAALKAEER